MTLQEWLQYHCPPYRFGSSVSSDQPIAKKSWSCWFQTADSDIDVLYGADDLQLAELLNRLHSTGIPFRMGEDQGIQHINFSEGVYDITVVKTRDFYVRQEEIQQEEERMQILYCRTADLLHSRLGMRNSYHYLDMRNSVAGAFRRLKTAFRRKPKSKLLAEVFLAGLACTSLGNRVCQPGEIFEASVAFCHFFFQFWQYGAGVARKVFVPLPLGRPLPAAVLVF